MSKVLNVRLPENVARKLESLSVRTKRPKSFFIKEILEMYLDELEDAYLALERLNEKNARYYTTEEAEKIVGL